MRPNHLLKLTAAAAVVSATTGAFATDTKDYPGVTCVQLDGSVAANLYGAVYNSFPSTSQDFMCPLVRDATNINSGYFKVIDHGAYTRVSCTINAESAYGGTFSGDWYYNLTGGTSDNWQTIPFFSVDAYDYYYAICTLPAENFGVYSYLDNIHVVEN